MTDANRPSPAISVTVEGQRITDGSPTSVAAVELLVRPDKTGVVMRFHDSNGQVLERHFPTKLFKPFMREMVKFAQECAAEEAKRAPVVKRRPTPPPAYMFTVWSK